MLAGAASAPPRFPLKRKEALRGPFSYEVQGPTGLALHSLLTTSSPDAVALGKSTVASGSQQNRVRIKIRAMNSTSVYFVFSCVNVCVVVVGERCSQPFPENRTKVWTDCAPKGRGAGPLG